MAGPMTAFQVDKYFDAIKQVGTANSTGLFGGLAALYYFRDQSAEIINAMKAASGLYLLGLFVFAAAYSAFFSFIDLHNPRPGADGDLFNADTSFRVARRATILSAMLWAIGSLVAAYVLYSLFKK